MGQKWGSNEDIHIGDIFWYLCGPNMSEPDSEYYQVVALRGRTQVVLRPLRTEKYINERIEEGSPLYWLRDRGCRPLPGQFMAGEELITKVRYERGKEIRRTGVEVTAWVLPNKTVEGRPQLQEVQWRSLYSLATPEDWEWDEDTIKELEERFFPGWRSSLTD